MELLWPGRERLPGPEGSLVEALLLAAPPSRFVRTASTTTHPFSLLLFVAPPFLPLLLNLFSSFPASPSTISRDLAQNIADRVGAILGLRLVVGEGKAAKGDYSKYRKPPLGIERSGTPRPGALLVWQKVIELLRYEDHLGFV